MSAGNKDPYSDPSGEQDAEANMRELAQLAWRLEAFAQSYSEDYRDGLEDSCATAVSSADLGNMLETDLSFSVERIREEVFPRILGEPITATYTVSSAFKRRHLAMKDVPQEVIDFLLESTDYDLSELEDEAVEYAFGFHQTFTISSEGDFEHDYGLSLHIDDDEVELPDEVLEATQDEPVPASDEIATGSDNEFMRLFLPEDIVALNSLESMVMKEQEKQDVLNRFCEELSKIRHVTRSMRYKMADNLVNQIFLPTTL